MSNRSPHVRCRLLLGLIALAAIAGSPLDARLRGFAPPSRLAATSVEAAQNPEFDLLIKGGRVIDPKNGVNAVMDVAVAGGKVALVAANIAAARAREVADASGLHVTPGLIDIHAHVFWGHDVESQYSDGYSAVQPDAHSFRSGQTTLVDVGGAGWKSFPASKRRSSTARRPASSRSSTSSGPACGEAPSSRICPTWTRS